MKNNNNWANISNTRMVEDLLKRKKPVKIEENDQNKPTDLYVKKIKNAIHKL